MREFHIVIQSFRDIQRFVSTATVQPFQVLVGNDAQLVNAKSFIGMVSLDYSRPLKVLCGFFILCGQFDFFRASCYH